MPKRQELLLIGTICGIALLGACNGGASDPEGSVTATSGPGGTTAAPTEVTVACDAELGLTPEAGVKVDWMDRERTWTVARNGDVYTLTRRSNCGDECSLVEEIVLQGGGDGCPALVSARTVRREAMTSQGPAEFVERAATGRLDLQDWDPESGVISGRLASEVAFTFYADFAP